MTGGGRAVGALLMLAGVAFVPALTSIVVAILVFRLQRDAQGAAVTQRGEQASPARDVDSGA